MFHAIQEYESPIVLIKANIQICMYKKWRIKCSINLEVFKGTMKCMLLKWNSIFGLLAWHPIYVLDWSLRPHFSVHFISFSDFSVSLKTFPPPSTIFSPLQYLPPTFLPTSTSKYTLTFFSPHEKLAPPPPSSPTFSSLILCMYRQHLCCFFL